jgi:Protein of unknown function (DUF3108)
MPETRLRQLLAAACVSAALIVPAFAGAPGTKMASLEPNTPGTLDIAYSIAFWGIPFGNTNYDGKFADDAYAVKSHFKTSGIVSVFWQSEIDATANGHYDAHEIEPALYDSYSRRSEEKKERVKVTYGDGPPQVFADPPYSTTKYPVSDAQMEEALDPMSAATSVMAGVTADAQNPCGKVAPVFDGRRRYNIEFTYIKDQKVKLDGGLFDGTAHLCKIKYHQIAGYKPKMIKEGQSWPPIYGLFADVPSASAPAGHFVIALKLWADTWWGTVSVHLTQLNVNGAKPGGKKG